MQKQPKPQVKLGDNYTNNAKRIQRKYWPGLISWVKSHKNSAATDPVNAYLTVGDLRRMTQDLVALHYAKKKV